MSLQPTTDGRPPLGDDFASLTAHHAATAGLVVARLVAARSLGSDLVEPKTGDWNSARFASLEQALLDTPPPRDGPDPTEGRSALEWPDSDALTGTVVAGRYRIRELIGEGGMGTIFLADQVEPVQREVALKLVRVGLHSRRHLAYLMLERQALALMDHPHIARVFDAGTTPWGAPFFVMELVRGVPLTNYCDQQRLRLTERLRLFQRICWAVQHAHQKEVVHRDLKPGNILVGTEDGEAVPKVIDFGLAKVLAGPRFTEQTLVTESGTIHGTPAYMAPEQATFQPRDIDARADIYALGAILYELLAGSTPVRQDRLGRLPLEEMLRLVREEDITPPSQRLHAATDLATLATRRQTEPASLVRFVRGDLDRIVLKALARRREDRYESASALADDLGRLLRGEPVVASPPDALDRARKFIRRHRSRVVAIGLLLVALVAGITGTTLGLLEAQRQEARARQTADLLDQARRAEFAQRRRAEERLRQVEQNNVILGSIFRDLNPRTSESSGKPLAALLGERLDEATAALAGNALGDPLAVARMQTTLGQSQLALGYTEKAILLFSRSRETYLAQLGPDHADTLELTHKLALAYDQVEQHEQALPLHQQALAGRRALFGPNDPHALATLNNLAICYRYLKDWPRCEAILGELLERHRAIHPADHPEVLRTMNNLASYYRLVDQFDRARDLHQQVLAARERTLGPDHPETLISLHNLAHVFESTEQYDLAAPLLERALAGDRRRLGPDHQTVLHDAVCYASILRNLNRAPEAIRLLEALQTDCVARYPPKSKDMITLVEELARNRALVPETVGPAAPAQTPLIP